MRPQPVKTFEQIDAAIADLIDKVNRGIMTAKEFRKEARAKVAEAGWKISDYKLQAKMRYGDRLFNIATVSNDPNAKNTEPAPNFYRGYRPPGNNPWASTV